MNSKNLAPVSRGPWRLETRTKISLTKDPTICNCEYRIVGTAFGGAPYGATNRMKGVSNWAR
eukprot:4163991-Pyramimonas_sp.AAC.1